MILAGLVVGADAGLDLHPPRVSTRRSTSLEEAIEQARALGVVRRQRPRLGPVVPLEVFVSPGGYIHGEESALLEAMEDRRGEPRNKPPFPVFNGLYNKPTVINNVETCAWVPGIVLNGGEWYRDGGINGAHRPALRLDQRRRGQRPGVYEVPFGQTVRELVFDTAGGMRAGPNAQGVRPVRPVGRLPAGDDSGGNLLPEKFVEEQLSSRRRRLTTSSTCRST